MGKGIVYTAKTPDATGRVPYSAGENAVWRDLYARQMTILPGRACPLFLESLARVGLPPDRIPQCSEVSAALARSTGVGIVPVPALIPNRTFFELLASGRFPCATFIRAREEFDYLQEPDVFHEVFGHTPLLSDPRFAAFTRAYGAAGLRCRDRIEEDTLARLYWFTIEFGLLRTPGGWRTYGAGILSSVGETVYAVESPEPRRERFELLTVLRTPYRIDIYQPLYYVLESFDELFAVAGEDLVAWVRRALREGDLPPAYPPPAEAALPLPSLVENPS